AGLRSEEIMKKWLFLALAVLLLVPAAPTFSWSKFGHAAIAGMTYDLMGETQTLRARRNKVIALLKQHPIFEKKWHSMLQSLPVEDRGKFLFMLASKWPDDMKTDASFRIPNQGIHGDWHFINERHIVAGSGIQIPDSVPLVGKLKAQLQECD